MEIHHIPHVRLVRTYLTYDQNSVFDQTGRAERLRRDKVRRLWIGGLALDVCVKASVLDALEEGFEVFILKEGVCPVTAEGGRKAFNFMRSAGAGFAVYPDSGPRGWMSCDCNKKISLRLFCVLGR